MSMDNYQDFDFEQMMEERMQDNLSVPAAREAEAEVAMDFTDERLREMSKRLPSWSLEPPYSFLK